MSERSFHPLSHPLQEGIRFFHHPLPAANVRRPCGHPCLPNGPDVASGLPRSVYATKLGRFCLFAGDTYVSVFAPSKQTTHHVPFGEAQLRLASSSLTTFISSSLYVNHPTQPSASSECNSRNHARPLAGYGVPHKVATLSERSAPHRYQWRTAPRLQGAEPLVVPASRRRHHDNCLHGLRRRTCITALPNFSHSYRGVKDRPACSRLESHTQQVYVLPQPSPAELSGPQGCWHQAAHSFL